MVRYLLKSRISRGTFIRNSTPTALLQILRIDQVPEGEQLWNRFNVQ